MEPLDKPSPYTIQVFVVYPANGNERLVLDMCELNALVPHDGYLLPDQSWITESIGGKRWLATADITSAFYQRLLHPEDRYHAAVISHRGHEQFAVTMMGYKRLMDKAFAGLTWRVVSVYVDDICIYADTFAEFLPACEEVFTILSNLGITLKAKKCFLGFHSLELLGYLGDRFGITTTASKSDALRNISFSVTLAQLEYFVGLVNWNRHLIPFFSQRMEPLQRLKTKLLRGAPTGGRARKEYGARTPVEETESLRSAFEDVTGTLADRPRLYHFEPGRPTYAFLDSSKEYGCGLAVYQLTGDPTTYEKARLVPLHFMSRELSEAEKRYWPTDKEMSGLVWQYDVAGHTWSCLL